MEKINKILIIMMFLITSFFIGNKVEDAKATSTGRYTSEYTNYHYSTYSSTGKRKWGQFKTKKIDDTLAYCIEVYENTQDNFVYNNNSEVSEYNKLPIDIQVDIGLYVYYGEELGSSNGKWELAVQKMVWERVERENDSSFITDFYTESTSNASNLKGKIDLSSEINAITKAVENHYKDPTISKNITLDISDGVVEFTDTNNILKEYEFDNLVAGVSIENNKLVIDATKVGTGNKTIKLSRRAKVDNGVPSIFFYDNIIQDIISFGIYDPINYTINLNIRNVDTNIEINKTDEEGNPLSGAVFEISDNENFNNSSEVITDENGLALTSITSSEATQSIFVREIKSPTGYVLDSAVQNKTVASGETANFDFTNIQITSTIQISKIDSNTKELIAGAELVIDYYDSEQEEWVEYGIYTSTEEVLIVENVPYGKYRLREVKAPLGYKISDLNIEFDVNENDGTIQLEIPNSKVLVETGVNYSVMYLSAILLVILFITRKFTNKI